jgi:hypothetical protein
MATQKPKRGRLPGKKIVDEVRATPKPTHDKSDSNDAQKVRPRGRLAAKKIVSDESSKGALAALRARRDAALKGKDGSDSPSLPLPAKHAPTSTPVVAAKARTSSSSRFKAAMPVQRAHTPSPRLNTDEDLYGLSPGGEASRIRLEVRRQSTQQQPPPSALKAQGTPAVETSILALANFKRRPRQHSIIRMVQQTSELGNQSNVDESLRDLDDTLRDFDAFNPDDESTPLHLSKRLSDSFSASKLRRKSALDTQLSSSRKRKHDDVENDIQVPRSSPPLASSPPRNARSVVVVSDSDSSTSSSAPEEVVPSTEQEQEAEADPERYSDTMAPPLSSSDISSPPRPQIVSKARPDKRRKTGTKADREALKQAPTSRNARQKRAPAISTDALQSLLPRARNQKRSTAKNDTYEIPSSDPVEASNISVEVDSDSDELARPVRKTRGTSVTTRIPIGKADGNRGRKRKVTEQPPLSTGKSLATANKEKRRRTYSRAPADKENDESLLISDRDSNSEDDEDGRPRKQRDSGIGMSASKELEAARKKFEEVDQWEMEFESVDLGGGQSSATWR